MSAAVGNLAQNRATGSYPQWCRPVRAAYERIFASLPRAAVPGTPNASMVRMITLLAALAVAMTAAIPPVSYFLAAQARLRGEVEIQTQLYASQVADEARQNPVFWNALAGSAVQPGLDGLAIARRPDADDANVVAERRRVFSGTGRILIETMTSAVPAWPVLVARLPVVDGPTGLGEVAIARSLRPALSVSIGVAFVSTGLSLLMFFLLRVAPLRMLAAAIEQASFLSAYDPLNSCLPTTR
jgi:hypothetical protein